MGASLGFHQASALRSRGDFCELLGGHKSEKNMKMQDEHGQSLVSGALDPRKMIS